MLSGMRKSIFVEPLQTREIILWFVTAPFLFIQVFYFSLWLVRISGYCVLTFR